MTTLKSQEITNELRDEIKRLRGSAMRRRDKRISNTLKQVHKPWHQRSVEDTVQHDGCLLYTSPSPRDVEESRMPSSA